MAEDRMYIKCKGCGAKILLGKHFGSHYTIFHDDKDYNRFFLEHCDCNMNEKEHHYLPTRYQDFELVYESELVEQSNGA